MPDITMCQNKTCPMRDKCYRAQAKPSKWQTYAGFEPGEDGECRRYWPMGKGEPLL